MTTTAEQNAEIRRLKESLKGLLNDLERNCLSKPGQPFPSLDELSKISGAIIQLAKCSGIQRVDPVHLCGVIKRLDRRHTKLGVAVTIGKLVDKVVAVPQGPATKIAKHIEKFPTSSEAGQLRKVLSCIRGCDWNTDISGVKGKDVFDALERFVSPSFNKAFPQKQRQTFGGTPEQSKLFYNALGMAAFADVHRRHLLWKASYEDTVIPVIAWLYLLLNPAWDAKLHKAFHGEAETVAELKKAHKKSLARKRVRDFRSRRQTA